MFILEIIRDTYTLKSTSGLLYLNGEKICHTLEDTVRGIGIKIPKHTGIPEGEYKVKVTMSGRFKRLMPMVYTEKNGYEIIKNDISFKGVRLHGGNTSENTEGCPLIAFNKIDNDTIQGTAEHKLTERLIELGGEGTLIVKNA